MTPTPSKLVQIPVKDVTGKMYLRQGLATGLIGDARISIDLIANSASLLITIGETPYKVDATEIASSIVSQLVEQK